MIFRAFVYSAALAVLMPATLVAQEIVIIPLEDLEDEPGFSLQQLEDDGITLETFEDAELDSGPRQVLTDEQFQSFEQETQVTQARAGSLRVLDKLTGVVTDLVLDAEASAIVGRITVTMHECRYPTESPTSDAFVRLSVADTAAGTRLFDGWMVASSPALMALDHPRYDVWALRCASGSETSVAGDDVISDIDDPLLAAEEAERPSGAVEVSLVPRPRPNR